MAHLGERFDPRPGTRSATGADEIGREPRAAIGRVEHHAGEHAELGVERLQLPFRPSSGETEEARALPEAFRRGGEDADADRFVVMP